MVYFIHCLIWKSNEKGDNSEDPWWSTYLVAIVHGRRYLSEDPPRVFFSQFAAFVDVVIQFTFRGTIKNHDDTILVFKHY